MNSDEIRVAKIAKELFDSIDYQLELISRDDDKFDLKKLLTDINQFQPCPQLLDKKLREFIRKLLSNYWSDTRKGTAHDEIFYNFGKVIGAKKILNYLDTDINLIPLVNNKITQQRYSHWHETYTLLIWATALSLTPFNLDSFSGDIRPSFYQFGLSQLGTSGPLQPLASRLLGSLIMRNDGELFSEKFISHVVATYHESSEITKLGLLQALNICLKKDLKLRLRNNISTISDFLQEHNSDESIVVITAKIYGNIAKYYIELDFYERFDEIFEFFDSNFANKSTETRIILSKKYTKILTIIDSCDSIELVHDVIFGTLESLEKESTETINSERLHTQLLTIAEIIRLGLLDYSKYQDLITILSKTLFFQQSRINFISGSNIRDASNYIVWSLARVRSEIDPNIVKSIILKMFFVSCFDKDIMIRRSSTAALQELIGRRGTLTWECFYPNDAQNSARSLAIIDALDYIDLGSIEKSYFEVPLKLIKIFPEWQNAFIDFLSENIYNIDSQLVRLSSKALAIILKSPTVNGYNPDYDEIIKRHIEIASQKPFNAFIGLSELLPLSNNQEIINEIIPTFNSIKLDHHKSSSFILKSYLYLTLTLVKLGHIPTSSTLENIFEAIRIDDQDIQAVLKEIAPLINLPREYWEKWLHYMKFGNLNTSITVSYLQNFTNQAIEVVKFLDNERVDSNVKAAILKSVDGYLQTKSLDHDLLLKILNSLDDYSISEQGDVGSKVRLSVIRLITNNTSKFMSLKDEIEPKLLRLAAEPLDKIRVDALSLLLKIRNEDPLHVDSRNIQEYFLSLLSIYQEHYNENESVSKEFWKGYAFTAGALKATDSLITASLNAFVEFYEKSLDDVAKQKVLLQLAANLKVDNVDLSGESFKSQRLTKLILVGLQFYSRILQLNITIPESLNIRGIFVRVYNLHLNTQNMTRLSSAIKIFGYFALVHDMKDAKKRLVWLTLNHPIKRVRVLASEELFLLYTEKSRSGNELYENALEFLKNVDWSSSNLKKYAKDIDV